jgi:formate dehydrogenase subunit gamma
MAEHHGEIVIARYSIGERIWHWILALAFVLAAVSGLALFHPALYWLSNVLGGGTWTRILHPYVGLLMFVAFALLGAAVAKYNRLDANDRVWLRNMRAVATNDESKLPEVGRYNAGQKLLFYGLATIMLLLLVTGVVMWRSVFSQYFSVGTIRLASLVHAALAFVLICMILLHVYFGISWAAGSMRAMTRGAVSPGWAWRHHRAWFREMIRAENSRTRAD